jgi:hypothetical protein
VSLIELGGFPSMSVKNVFAVIGAIALVVIFRAQIVQIINMINSMVTVVP